MPGTVEQGIPWDDRARIADAMCDADLNKCVDCCLVPDCDACGPCEHNPEAEQEAAEEWMRYNT